MGEYVKMILEEMRKMEERIVARMSNLEIGIAGNSKAIITTHGEIKSEFTVMRTEMQASHDELSKKIDDLQQVTGQNCYELTLLKTKQA